MSQQMNQQDSSFIDPERKSYQARNTNRNENENRNAQSDPREQQGGYRGVPASREAGYRARDVNTDPREQPGEGYSGEYVGPGVRQQMMMGEKLTSSPDQRRRGRPWLWIVVLLVIVLALGGGLTGALGQMGSTGSSQTHTFNVVGSHPRLVINDGNGRIQIHTVNSGNTVTVHDTESAFGLGDANQQVNYSQNGDTINVNANQDTFFLGVRTVNLDVTVPTTTDLEVQTGSGSVEVTGDNGQITVQSGSGNITATDVNGQGGPITLKTGSGNITTDNVSSQDNPITLKTGSGNIRADSINGQVVLETGSGNIDMNQAQLKGQSTLHTGSGDINVQGALDPQGSYQLDTGSGLVNMTLPSNASFHMNEQTGSGSFNNEFGSTDVGSGQKADVTIHTGSGSINLHKGS